nr:MAG TPA: hypothetical protein [Caudoviricetes sp.]
MEKVTIERTHGGETPYIEKVTLAAGKYYLVRENTANGSITSEEITETNTDPRTGRVDLVLPENDAGRKFLAAYKVTEGNAFTLVPRYGYTASADPASCRTKTDRLPYWFDALDDADKATYNAIRAKAIARMESPAYALQEQIKKQLAQLEKLQAQLRAMQG